MRTNIPKELFRHFGHGTATSAGTGRVKCLTWPQPLHPHASDRRSSEYPRKFSAYCASSRIFSRMRRTEFDGSAIDSVPVVAGGDGVASRALEKSLKVDSCSSERIQRTPAVDQKIAQRWLIGNDRLLEPKAPVKPLGRKGDEKTVARPESGHRQTTGTRQD